MGYVLSCGIELVFFYSAFIFFFHLIILAVLCTEMNLFLFVASVFGQRITGLVIVNEVF